MAILHFGGMACQRSHIEVIAAHSGFAYLAVCDDAVSVCHQSSHIRTGGRYARCHEADTFDAACGRCVGYKGCITLVAAFHGEVAQGMVIACEGAGKGMLCRADGQEALAAHVYISGNGKIFPLGG